MNKVRGIALAVAQEIKGTSSQVHRVALRVVCLVALIGAMVGAVPTPAHASAGADVGVTVLAPSAVPVGDRFDYTVVITNHGPDSATGVRMTDSLPAQSVTFIGVASTDATDLCSGNSGSISCELGTMTVNESATVTITVERIGAGGFWNYASVNSDSDPFSSNNTDSAEVTSGSPGSAADLGISMAVSGTPPVGQSFDIALTVRNDGPDTATNVVVRDYLSSDLAFESVAPSTCGYSNGNRLVSCYAPSLASGSQIVVTITGHRTSGYQITNSAYVEGDQDPSSSNDYANVTIAGDPTWAADVAASVSTPAQTPGVGDSFQISSAAHNSGPRAADQVHLELYWDSREASPNGFTVSKIGSACHLDQGRLSCDVQSLAVGETVSVTVTLMRTESRWINVWAYASSRFDLVSNNNQTSAQIDIDAGAAADVGILVEGPESVPAAGAQFAEVITVTNHGPGGASDVSVNQYLPAAVDFISTDFQGCVYTGSSKSLTCDVRGGIPSGGARVITVVLKRTAAAEFSLGAYVDSLLDTNDENDWDEAAIEASPTDAADVAVHVLGPATNPAVSQDFASTVTVTNAGPAVARNIKLALAVPVGARFVAVTPTSCWYRTTSRNVRCNVASLGMGSSASVTVTLRRTSAQAFPLTADVTSDVDPNGDNDTDSVDLAAAAVAVGGTRVPTTAKIQLGSLNGGTVANLSGQDGVFYSLNSALSSSTNKSAWYGTFTGVPASPTSLKVAYAGNNTRSASQTIAIWRWSDSKWVPFDTRTVGASQVLAQNLTPPGAPSIYVSGSGEVRVKVSTTTASGSFISRGDVLSLNFA